MSQEHAITLECSVCKRGNYRTDKNKKMTKERLALQKFCSTCRMHTEHKETK